MQAYTHPQACREHACIQETLRYKHPPISRSNLHSKIATLAQKTCSQAQLHTQQPMCLHQQPFTTQIHMKQVCLHTHSHSSTHGFVSVHSPMDLQPIPGHPNPFRNIYHNQWSAHTKTHPCTLTYVLMKVLVWEIPFQETKIIVKRKKQSTGNCTNRCKRILTRTLWSLSVRVPITTTSISAQHLLGMLPLSAKVW